MSSAMKTKTTTKRPGRSFKRSGAACPDCGCALLQEHETTHDRYAAQLRVRHPVQLCLFGTDAEIVVTHARWIKGFENEEVLVGCTRCGALLTEDDLDEASEDEQASAWDALEQLESSVPNGWEASEDDGAVGECCQCGSQEFVVDVEREVQLAALYFFHGWSPECHNRWPTGPWSVDWTLVSCASCYGITTMAEVAWRE